MLIPEVKGLLVVDDEQRVWGMVQTEAAGQPVCTAEQIEQSIVGVESSLLQQLGHVPILHTTEVVAANSWGDTVDYYMNLPNNS